MVLGCADSFNTMHALEGYERLPLDGMLGDQSLLTCSDGVERLCEASTPLLETAPVDLYAPGSLGPDSVRRLIAPHHWSLPHRR